MSSERTINESSTMQKNRVRKTLQSCTGELRRSQRHLGEARLPAVSRAYAKLPRNPTSEPLQSTLHNHPICTTALQVWHSTRTQLTQSATLAAPPVPAAAASSSSRASEIPARGKTALQLELADVCTQYFTRQHWLKAIFSFCTIATLHIRLPLNAQMQQQTASGSAKNHSALSSNSLQAPQSKGMLLSALLTAQNTLDQIKCSGESVPFSKWGAYTPRPPNYTTAT